jgi:hypothetical protein
MVSSVDAGETVADRLGAGTASAHVCRADPPFGSGPLATVVQDLLSLLIYFGVAAVLVG